jgi:hypothetical protein
MTKRLASIKRPFAMATVTPTHLDRSDVALADPAEGRTGEPVVEPAVAQAPLLITEQQVIFGTAAALRVPGKKTAGQRIARLRARRPFLSSRADGRAAKDRHYPHNYYFLEQALMAREMDRL